MNCALIFAGGTGQRMNSKSVPKQFLKVHGKPIIIHTLEIFDRHQEIDGIVVVCLDGWISYLKEQLDAFSITKVKGIVKGGNTGQDSIFNGLAEVDKLYDDNTIVLIHDGVRPLIDNETITLNIDSVKKNGNAITVSPALETIAVGLDGKKDTIGTILERRQCMLAKAPQSFYLKDIYDAHVEARNRDIHNYIDSAYLMQDAGHKLFAVNGPAYNIKITTPADYYVFHAILDAHENEQIYGI